jgi:hypothetical protein
MIEPGRSAPPFMARLAVRRFARSGLHNREQAYAMIRWPLLARAALTALLAFLSPGAHGEPPDRALDAEIAREFMALELAGWRLPSPVESCLSSLKLKRLEPIAFGSEELIDQPVLVDSSGPHFRLAGVESDPSDKSGKRRIVRFEWLLPPADGMARTEQDSFAFVVNAASKDGVAAAMVREPMRLVIRRECFGS